MEVDDQFVHSLKKGNADAYETLVRRFEAPLYRFFLAAHGDPQLANEQSADCFGDLVGRQKGDAFNYITSRTRPPSSHYEGNHKEDQEDHEQDLCDPRGVGGDTPETEYGCDECDDQEDKCPSKHLITRPNI